MDRGIWENGLTQNLIHEKWAKYEFDLLAQRSEPKLVKNHLAIFLFCFCEYFVSFSQIFLVVICLNDMIWMVVSCINLVIDHFLIMVFFFFCAQSLASYNTLYVLYNIYGIERKNIDIICVYQRLHILYDPYVDIVWIVL